MGELKDLRLYENKELIAILRSCQKIGMKKYKQGNDTLVWNVFVQLRENQQETANYLNQNYYPSRKGFYLDVPIYEEVLRLQLDSLQYKHSWKREPLYEKLTKLIDIANEIEQQLENTKTVMLNAYQTASKITKQYLRQIKL